MLLEEEKQQATTEALLELAKLYDNFLNTDNELGFEYLLALKRSVEAVKLFEDAANLLDDFLAAHGKTDIQFVEKGLLEHLDSATSKENFSKLFSKETFNNLIERGRNQAANAAGYMVIPNIVKSYCGSYINVLRDASKAVPNNTLPIICPDIAIRDNPRPRL